LEYLIGILNWKLLIAMHFLDGDPQTMRNVLDGRAENPVSWLVLNNGTVEER
jgi:hypothetical protein